MCGRYTLLQDELTIKQRFQFTNEIENFTKSYNIAPTQQVLAIIFDGQEKRAGYLRWGLIPSWAKDEKIGSKMINARVETLHEKPSFRGLLTQKRCLVVADSFYEWQQTENGKKVNRIHHEADKLFAFAALWDKWEYGNKRLFTCTLITKEANAFMQPIHHRMPIIIPREQEDEWLTATFEKPIDAQNYLQSLSDPALKTYEVSNYVNNVQNNDESCITPITQ